MEEFPDISISKIRYLEGQGLLAPRRTQSGYRLYSDEDVERLRTILQLQRDEFLPLRVIRDELMSPGTSGARAAVPPRGRSRRPSRPSTCARSASAPAPIAAFVRELEDFGILEPVEEDGREGLSRARHRDRVRLRAAAAVRHRAAQPARDPKRGIVDGRASSSRSSRRRSVPGTPSAAAQESKTSRRSPPRHRSSRSCSSGAPSGRSSE